MIGIGDLLRPLCLRCGVSLRLELSDHLPSLPCDRVALRHALLPLLIQAIDAALGAEIVVTALCQEQRVNISIRGLPLRFPEASQAAVAESQPFVNALSGTLAFVTTPRDSCAMTLSLPASDRSMLLVVDNHLDFTQLVTRYLAGDEWDVVSAVDVDRAFSIAQARHPRAVLLDVVIPGRDGWDLLSQLKASHSTRDIPVVICSILAEPEVALTLGAAAYLRKPIDRERLVHTLEGLR